MVSLEDCELALASSQGHTLASVCLLLESVVLRFHGVLYTPGQPESEKPHFAFHVVGNKVRSSNLMIPNIKEGAQRCLRIW